MPDKRFSSKAIIYSSSEDSLYAYLYGEKIYGITNVSIPFAFSKGAIRGDRVEVNVYVKAIKKRQRAVFTNSFSGRIKYHPQHTMQGYAIVTKIISPKEFEIAGRIEEGGVHTMFTANNDSGLRAPVFNADMNGAVIGDIVLARVTRKNTGALRAQVIQVLGKENQFKARYESILYNGGFKKDFSEEVIHQTEIISLKSISEIDRSIKDFRSKNIFTLENEPETPTKAYSFEKTESGYNVGIYYSDIDSYISWNSDLDDELFHRFSSFELPEGKFEFLPPEFKEKFKLNAGEDKIVFAIMLDIDKKGYCRDLAFENAVINVAENGTTEEVNELFSNIDKTKTQILGIKYSTVIQKIWNMFDLCAILSRDKTYEFCQLCQINNIQYDIKHGEPIAIKYKKPNDIDLMLNIIDTLVGVELAKYTSSKNIPFLYETQLPPTYESIMSLPYLNTPLVVDETTICRLLFMYNFVLADSNDKRIRAASINMQRLLQPRAYSTTPGNHYSLAQFSYSKFTNPCENYMDLTLLRVLKASCDEIERVSLEMYLQKAIMSYRINGTKNLSALEALDVLMNEQLALKNGTLPIDAMVKMLSSDGIEILLPNGAVGMIPMICVPNGSYNREARVIEYQKERVSFGDTIKVTICDEEYNFTKKFGKGIIYKFIR